VAETITTSPEETIALGKAFGATLRAGDVVFLEGDLGAGKTTFVRGVAAACGIASGVKSPTFALMHRYRGKPDIVHIDLYRQAEESGLDDLAIEEWGTEVITLVEWPKEFAAEQWPSARRVVFRHIDEGMRGIEIPGNGR
jgi:tRNA threonylcarbamoyladenosine biosynthesis protein TsaE